MAIKLIRTTMGTARFMTEDDMLQDLNLAIVKTYKLMTSQQIEDLMCWCITDITDNQVDSIKDLAGV